MLGPQGVKSALRLQASPRAVADRAKMGRIKKEKEDDGEDIDELAGDASIASVRNRNLSSCMPTIARIAKYDLIDWRRTNDSNASISSASCIELEYLFSHHC